MRQRLLAGCFCVASGKWRDVNGLWRSQPDKLIHQWRSQNVAKAHEGIGVQSWRIVRSLDSFL